ncbi:MAG: AAA family ATPase [Pseudomonadota bacterium]
MKIKSITIDGLHGVDSVATIDFNDDINILTGRNGSGKTTILKLVWYLISANIERAVREIRFSRVVLSTDAYTLEIRRSRRKDREIAEYKITSSVGDVLLDKLEPRGRDQVVEDANQLTIDLIPESIFFPTFRRIEGGFSMTDGVHLRSRHITRGNDGYIVRRDGFGSDIQEAIANHAEMLSVQGHRFVSSISTVDIQKVVTQRHNDATNRVESFSKSLSDKIFQEIRDYNARSGPEISNTAEQTLEKIYKDVQQFEKTRKDEFQSLKVLSDVVHRIFDHKGIRLNARVTLGEIGNSMNSEALSAGEKQMLSFLCYNAFFKGCPFFIDEPELSLHVDWQRMLLDVLLEQESGNQYFIATHSPFIYTPFEDKEILISLDRGDSLGE